MKDENISRIHSLYELLVNRYASPQEAFRAILNKGLKEFNLSLGIISKVERDNYFLLSVLPLDGDLSEGEVFELKKTYCQRVINEKKVISIEHAGIQSDYNTHPVYINMKLESYISAPIWVRGCVWGTLNFSSTQVRYEPFSEEDREFISLMADGIGSLVERNLLNLE
ncbi:GAF domain-containing protein, partial [Salmonella enterica]|nr:GAF domain-containing protein [Salmonella enterica]